MNFWIDGKLQEIADCCYCKQNKINQSNNRHLPCNELSEPGDVDEESGEGVKNPADSPPDEDHCLAPKDCNELCILCGIPPFWRPLKIVDGSGEICINSADVPLRSLSNISCCCWSWIELLVVIVGEVDFCEYGDWGRVFRLERNGWERSKRGVTRRGGFTFGDAFDEMRIGGGCWKIKKKNTLSYIYRINIQIKEHQKFEWIIWWIVKTTSSVLLLLLHPLTTARGLFGGIEGGTCISPVFLTTKKN